MLSLTPAAVAFCGALSFIAWRDLLPIIRRVVDIWERRQLPAPTPIVEPPSLPDTKLPEDIELLASRESETWARDAVRERAWELWRSTKSWDDTKMILIAERQINIFGDTDTGVN